MSRRRLGYLLKHANLRLTQLTGPALEPYGIDGRELAVLHVLDEADPLSQQEAARRLRIDRTTMVALIDTLEGKKLVSRRPHPDDRRKNMVELTTRGRDTLRDGGQAVEEAERAFLAKLPADDAAHLRDLLDKLV
ncbi:MarR family winged helix-turn-helix transcriptional regulator [Nonomuraea sp. NEAU-A123]|uniref:MarR family winged helix-turn-helix transcriptional regulator n=1 Tax=Nonomuraea sp. NEAU-A123 TaxID=2839649 RepID=UPI001BE48FA3|nr:MarR family transcriptional regulator [Nonomuraea sp. NEAU-A123]MBT2227185.1 MarR family transcriptional regulator [Nonomuraea sp. NEAU-A123]